MPHLFETAPPEPRVLRAFGAPDRQPELLPGGQGRTWRVGDLVLKPVGNDEEHAWVSDVFDGWPAHDTVRVPRPVRSSEDGWAFEGWAAHLWLEGSDLPAGDRPDLVRRVCEEFHEVISHLERPGFLDGRDDAWTFGDLVAWEGEEPQGHPPTLDLLREGLAGLRPVSTPSQVVHGDIGGNILAAKGRPPAVIDWPPYYRPAGWALAVAAGDAVAWAGAPLSLFDDWSDIPEWDQLLLRAVVYRIATRGRLEALGHDLGSSEEYVGRRRPSLEAALARVED